MFSLQSVSDIESFLLFPLVTIRNNNRYTIATFTFTNVASTLQHSVNHVDISTVGDIQDPSYTFQKLKLALSIVDIQRIEDTIQTLYQDSQLYEDSLIRLDIVLSSPSTDQTITLSRYFLIPTIVQGMNIVPVTYQLEGGILHYGFSLPQLSGKQTIVSTTLGLIIRTKWSDILLDTHDYIKEKSIIQHTTVQGYDMTQCIMFVVGTQMDAQGGKLLGYNTLDETMILVPQVNFQKGRTYMQGTTKKQECTITITSKAFNGLDYVDYGYLFYNRGYRLSVPGLPSATLELRKAELL